MPQPGASTQTPRSWAGSSVPCRNETCRKLFWAVGRRVYCEACLVERENRRDRARLRRLSRAASDLNQLVRDSLGQWRSERTEAWKATPRGETVTSRAAHTFGMPKRQPPWIDGRSSPCRQDQAPRRDPDLTRLSAGRSEGRPTSSVQRSSRCSGPMLIRAASGWRHRSKAIPMPISQSDQAT